MTEDANLIAAIYEAAIDPAGWNDVVKRIVGATRSLSGALIFHEAETEHFEAPCNIDPFYANAYATTYCKINPLAATAAQITPGELSTGTSLTQTDHFKASAFYNEFAQPQGWADVIRIGLVRTPDVAGRLALHRSPDAIWVEPAEWQLLHTLAPHLKRAAAIQEALSRAAAAVESLGAADAAGIAILLLAKDSRVLYANAKAEELLRSKAGLRCERGRLAATAPALTARLQALAHEAACPGGGEGDSAGTFEIKRGENLLPYPAHIFPLAASREPSIFGIDRPTAAVVAVDPGVALSVRIQSFAARFGLTAAETRVLEELIGGNRLPGVAAQLGISYATARTHLQHILTKTGTNRQTELIRQFFEAAIASLPGEARPVRSRYPPIG
jgi:DNA-binding CsgD family transcriptional regulator/PAS domain-containing protein